MKSKFEKMEPMILAVLLSVFSMISLELQGRLNFGGGALDTATFDIENILIPNPEYIPNEMKIELNIISRQLMKRDFLPLEDLLKTPLQQRLDRIVLKFLNLDMPLSQIYQDLSKIQVLRRNKKMKTEFKFKIYRNFLA